MASATVQTRRRQPDAVSSPEERRRCVVRRRILLLVLVAALIGLAVWANYGPITHYLDARSRLDQATSEVAVLEEQNAQMQAELSRLLEPTYLEELARDQLTYARPDEELYIVTGGEDGTAEHPTASGTGVGAVVATSDESDPTLSTTPAAGAGEGAATGDMSEGDDAAGFLERLLSRIAGLF